MTFLSSSPPTPATQLVSVGALLANLSGAGGRLSRRRCPAPQPPVRRAGKRGHRAHPSTASAFSVEQGYGVRDARDEPAQAGEQQQFFDLPDHDVLPPEKVPETPTTRSRNLGSEPARARHTPVRRFRQMGRRSAESWVAGVLTSLQAHGEKDSGTGQLAWPLAIAAPLSGVLRHRQQRLLRVLGTERGRIQSVGCAAAESILP
jgi:hypothetical protein